MKKILSLVAVIMVALCTAPAALAAGDPEIEQLQKQLDELNRRYAEQGYLVQMLSERLQKLEVTGHGTLLPLKATTPSDAVADERTAAKFYKTADTSEPAPSAPKQQGTEEKIVKEAPASKSVEAVYKEQGSFFGGRHFTFEPALTYSHFDSRQINLSGFLALDAIFLGTINVNKVKADILTLDLTSRYSVDRFQFEVDAPFLYRTTTFQSGGAGGAAATLSEATVTRSPKLGDVNAGFFYKLLPETQSTPDFVWNVRFKAPTGTIPYGIKVVTVPGSNGNLTVPTELPTGNGVWTASSGVTVVKTTDPAILFASLSYFYNFERHFRDINTDQTAITPGKVKLGDSYQFGLGTAFALNERMSLSLSYAQLIQRQSRVTPDGLPTQTIIGSDANVGVMNVGVTYALTDHLTAVTNLGVGLTPDAPNLTFTMKFPYTF